MRISFNNVFQLNLLQTAWSCQRLQQRSCGLDEEATVEEDGASCMIEMLTLHEQMYALAESHCVFS